MPLYCYYRPLGIFSAFEISIMPYVPNCTFIVLLLLNYKAIKIIGQNNGISKSFFLLIVFSPGICLFRPQFS